jgi:hypothetical protein
MIRTAHKDFPRRGGVRSASERRHGVAPLAKADTEQEIGSSSAA